MKPFAILLFCLAAVAQGQTATPAQTSAFFLGREDAAPTHPAHPAFTVTMSVAAVSAPPADICTGPYFFQRLADSAWMVGWPNDWINTEYQGGSAHTIIRHDISLGKDWSCCDQDTGGNPNARGYPKPPDAASYAMERFIDCYVDEPPQVPSSYLTACNKPTPPGTQTLPGKTLAQVTDPSKKASWTAGFGCATATPTPSPVPTPTANVYADWIEQLWKDGISSGCGGGNFCPKSNITREQLAVWILRAKYGPTYQPPPCTNPPTFLDVPCGH